MLDRYLPRIEFDSYEDFRDNYRVNVPDNFNFGWDIVDEWAKQEPEKKALLWLSQEKEERTFTFTDISKLSNQTCHYFKSLGLKKGDVVLLILRRRWEYWVIATALHKLGIILIPGNLLFTTHDIAYRGNMAEISAIIACDDEYIRGQIDGAAPQIKTLRKKIAVAEPREGWDFFTDEIAKYPDTFERPTGDEATKATDTMLIYFTSGSTGMPKMVCHNFAHPLGHIVTAKYWHQVQENKLHMSISDSGWAKFGWGKIYGQWICGAIQFVYDFTGRFNAKDMLEVISNHKLTTFCAPPTMYRFMLQEDMTQYDLSTIQNFCNAGEPLNPEVFNRIYELTGKKMREGFGQTEGTVLVANFPWIDPKPGSMGKPSPLYNIHLLRPDGTECEDGEEGSIMACGIDKQHPTGLFCGYYKNPELTEAVLGGENYDTGDVAWRDSRGYFWFVGRNDDVIKCSGYRIGPFEVESALLTHPAVVESAITGAPDPIRGQVVKATVVLAKGYTPSPELTKELQDHVKKETAPYKYPRVIEYVDELPKTLGGKIKRAQIRHTDEENFNK
ncbi:MAG: AMP-binding protein [Oscillospiraceae bacterium]|nr:AMP-binding protein [Oscillospiraceae bacterium]